MKSVKHYEQTCRACGMKDGSTLMVSLNERNLRKLLAECTTLEVPPDDGLPQKLCPTCMNKCLRWNAFKIMTLEKQQTFKEDTDTIEEDVVDEDADVCDDQLRSNSPSKSNSIPSSPNKTCDSNAPAEDSDSADDEFEKSQLNKPAARAYTKRKWNAGPPRSKRNTPSVYKFLHAPEKNIKVEPESHSDVEKERSLEGIPVPRKKKVMRKIVRKSINSSIEKEDVHVNVPKRKKTPTMKKKLQRYSYSDAENEKDLEEEPVTVPRKKMRMTKKQRKSPDSDVEKEMHFEDEQVEVPKKKQLKMSKAPQRKKIKLEKEQENLETSVKQEAVPGRGAKLPPQKMEPPTEDTSTIKREIAGTKHSVSYWKKPPLTIKYVERVSETVPLICHLCNGAFSTFDYYQTHFEMEHEDEANPDADAEVDPAAPYATPAQKMCFTCDMEIPAGSSLFQHTLIKHMHSQFLFHEKVPEYQCDNCEERFFDNERLTMHRRDGHCSGQELYHCVECNARFNYATFSAHQRTVHPGRRSFMCSMCEAVFGSPGELRIHMRIHTGERPYSCHICNKAFSVKSNCKRHVMRHLQPSKNRKNLVPYSEVGRPRAPEVRPVAPEVRPLPVSLVVEKRVDPERDAEADIDSSIKKNYIMRQPENQRYAKTILLSAAMITKPAPLPIRLAPPAPRDSPPNADSTVGSKSILENRLTQNVAKPPKVTGNPLIRSYNSNVSLGNKIVVDASDLKGPVEVGNKANPNSLLKIQSPLGRPPTVKINKIGATLFRKSIADLKVTPRVMPPTKVVRNAYSIGDLKVTPPSGVKFPSHLSVTKKTVYATKEREPAKQAASVQSPMVSIPGNKALARLPASIRVIKPNKPIAVDVMKQAEKLLVEKILQSQGTKKNDDTKTIPTREKIPETLIRKSSAGISVSLVNKPIERVVPTPKATIAATSNSKAIIVLKEKEDLKRKTVEKSAATGVGDSADDGYIQSLFKRIPDYLK